MDDTGFPQMGGGVWEPLSHLVFINYYNALMFGAPFWSWKVIKKAYKALQRRGMKKGELEVIWGAWNFKISPTFLLNLSRKDKNQQAMYL